jgi:hypothetical protein
MEYSAVAGCGFGNECLGNWTKLKVYRDSHREMGNRRDVKRLRLVIWKEEIPFLVVETGS